MTMQLRIRLILIALLVQTTPASAAPFPSAVLVAQTRPGLVEPLTDRADALAIDGVAGDELEASFVDDLDGDGRADLLINGSAFGECGSVYLVPSTLREERALDASSIGDYVRFDGLGGRYPGDCGQGTIDSMEPLGDVNGDGVGDLWLVRSLGEYPFTGYILFGRIDAGARVDVATSSSGRVLTTGYPLPVGDLNGDGFDDLFYEPYAPIVVPGRSVWPQTIDPGGDSSSGTLVSFTRAEDAIFFRPTPAGDVNGDGVDDLLVQTVNRNLAFIIQGARDLNVVIDSDADYERLAIYSECKVERIGLDCPVGPLGDVDADGFDDLGSYGLILYGSPDGLPPAGEGARVPDANVTRLIGGAPFNGDDRDGALYRNDLGFHPAGDVNGDGVDDFYLEDFLVVFGFPAGRPATLDTARLDGRDGFFLSTTDNRGQGFANGSRPLTGDFDGDGIDDLIVFDVLILGQRDSGTPASPPDVRARFGPATADILWSTPADAAGITGYEIRLGGDVVAIAEADATRVTLGRADEALAADTVYSVASIGIDGRTAPPVERPFLYVETDIDYLYRSNEQPIENLRAPVYGPQTLELIWDAEPERFLVLRDDAPLTLVEGHSLMQEALETGRTYEYVVLRARGPDQYFSGYEEDVNTTRCFVECRPLEATFAAVGRSERVSATPGDVATPEPDPSSPVGVIGLDHAVYSDTAVELFWQRAGGDSRVIGYEVRRDGEVLTTRDATSYFDDTLRPDSRYLFSVAAIELGGNRLTPVTVTVTTRASGAPGLASPGGLRADIYSATAAELFWNRATTPGLRYEVFRDGVLVGATDGTSYFDDAFDAAQGARYEVGAVAADESVRSSTAALVLDGL